MFFILYSPDIVSIAQLPGDYRMLTAVITDAGEDMSLGDQGLLFAQIRDSFQWIGNADRLVLYGAQGMVGQNV